MLSVLLSEVLCELISVLIVLLKVVCIVEWDVLVWV